MAPNNAPKIKDVARLAGVSTATVSRALSKPETVAPKTREAVLAAAAQSGYRVNLSARNLRSKRAGAIIVLVPNLGNPFFSEILAGIESVTTTKGLSVLMLDTKQSGSNPAFLFSYLQGARADGIISLDGTLPDSLLDTEESTVANLPTVFACEWHHQDRFPSVRADNAQGARLAVEHLIELGHTKIGYVDGPAGNVLSQERQAAMRSALKQAGITPVEDWFLSGDFSLDAGVRAARALLDLPNRPTAMCCANDETAFGLISESHKQGIEVPGHLSVVGFDDIDICRRYIPPLTTIRQPRTSLGTTVAEMLVARFENGEYQQESLRNTLPVELIIRESTAPPVQ